MIKNTAFYPCKINTAPLKDNSKFYSKLPQFQKKFLLQNFQKINTKNHDWNDEQPAGGRSR
jgi:hypothetical protein